MLLDELETPIVLAPLAGGPSTPELAAAVSQAGGLGFLAAGYLSAEETRTRIAAVRAATDRPFGVNLFVPGRGPTDPALYDSYARRLRSWAAARGLEAGEPVFGDDAWDAKLALLHEDPVRVVSLVFGCPEPAVLAALKARGCEV